MEVKVKFDGQEIIVTKPGTDFMFAYRMRSDSPNLVLTRSWEKPTVTSPEISEFRAHAFHTAVSKARELGHVLINEHCLSLALPALLHLEDLIRSQSARTPFVVAPHA